mmetsp:Transcript_31739/g.58148  ORF Transcript_31739/g.58148 Transcript_31739/m.58148 type:complete len:198 (-) Transcript_31739:609-1202(-)
MISNTLLRTASRRILSAGSSHTKRAASSSRVAAFKQSEQESRKFYLPLTMALCSWGLMQQTLSSEEEMADKNTAQCLFNSDKKAQEVEDKFAAYWPRNIMILFGPPGELPRCRPFIGLYVASVRGHGVLISTSCLISPLPPVNNISQAFKSHCQALERERTALKSRISSASPNSPRATCFAPPSPPNLRSVSRPPPS